MNEYLKTKFYHYLSAVMRDMVELGVMIERRRLGLLFGKKITDLRGVNFCLLPFNQNRDELGSAGKEFLPKVKNSYKERNKNLEIK